MKAARVGCSGWNYRDWRGDLDPEGVPAKRWLEALADSGTLGPVLWQLPGDFQRDDQRLARRLS